MAEIEMAIACKLTFRLLTSFGFSIIALNISKESSKKYEKGQKRF